MRVCGDRQPKIISHNILVKHSVVKQIKGDNGIAIINQCFTYLNVTDTRLTRNNSKKCSLPTMQIDEQLAVDKLCTTRSKKTLKLKSACWNVCADQTLIGPFVSLIVSTSVVMELRMGEVNCNTNGHCRVVAHALSLSL